MIQRGDVGGMYGYGGGEGRWKREQSVYLLCSAVASLSLFARQEAGSAHLFNMGGEGRTHQSSPSSSPSPLIAQLLKMLHCRFLSVSSPSPSDTSAADIASG